MQAIHCYNCGRSTGIVSSQGEIPAEPGPIGKTPAMVRKAERMKINAPGASYSALSHAVDRSGPFHLIVWVLVQIATSSEAAKFAKSAKGQ